MQIKRIGVLTGGGDCPGLNAAIRAVVRTAAQCYGAESIGFFDGYEGLVENRYRLLLRSDVAGILPRGGTLLGTSNRSDPFQYPISQGDETIFLDRSADVIRHAELLGLNAVVVIGGDGTMTAASQLAALGLPVIGVPKTIDNDLIGTDITFGFDSAVSVATEAIDRIHTTAQSHHRIMIVEVMGRNAGWLALASGMAAGGDIILLPEFPYQLEVIAEEVRRRRSEGKSFSIVVIGEGARCAGGERVVSKIVENAPDKIRLGGVSHQLAAQLETLLTIECRVTILGHLVRGGSPTAYDRLLASSFGSQAVHELSAGNLGRMVSMQGGQLTTVPLETVAGKQRLITEDVPLLAMARSLGVCLGYQSISSTTDKGQLQV